MINELTAAYTFMNTTKNITIPWLKRGAVVALVILSLLLINTSVALASSASASSSSSASASGGSASAASSAAAVATTGSTSASAASAAAATAAANASAAAATAAANASAASAAAAAAANAAAASAASNATATASASSAVAASCAASASSVAPGSSVIFSVNASGGNGNFLYSWTGTDGLFGSSRTVSQIYNTAGIKSAIVTVTSGHSSASASCSVYVNPLPPPTPVTLNGSCSANTSNAQVGDTVSWSATGVTGGTGNYTYSWTGADGLSGNNQTVSRSYSTSGTKSAAVVITSGNQSVTRNCSTYVANNTPVYNQLGGSCYANQSSGYVGDTISFTAQPTGGNGSYTYSWTGDEGLSGNSQTATRAYSYSGTKSATVTIYSDGQTVTRNCSTYINNQYVPPVYPPYYPPVYNNLNASCVANQSSAYVGDAISWSATGVTGGSGNYSYSWTGTDGLYGNNYSAYQTYNTAGTKVAYLTVYSNGQSISRTCSLYVNDRYNYNYNYTPPITYINPQPPYYPPTNSVSLTQVPYTGLESNMKVVLFTIALIMWSAIVTYIVIIRKRSKLALATVAGSDEAQQSARQEVLMGHDSMLSNLEGFARSQNAIISGDALAAVVDIAGNDEKKAQALISSIANRHATGGDWTILDLKKVQSAIG